MPVGVAWHLATEGEGEGSTHGGQTASLLIGLESGIRGI